MAPESARMGSDTTLRSSSTPVRRNGRNPIRTIQAVHSERFPDHRLRHVTYPDAPWGDALLAAHVGVAVDREVRAGVVDRLREEITAQERVDLRRLAAQG